MVQQKRCLATEKPRTRCYKKCDNRRVNGWWSLVTRKHLHTRCHQYQAHVAASSYLQSEVDYGTGATRTQKPLTELVYAIHQHINSYQQVHPPREEMICTFDYIAMNRIKKPPSLSSMLSCKTMFYKIASHSATLSSSQPRRQMICSVFDNLVVKLTYKYEMI